jgi:hypothetical protein
MKLLVSFLLLLSVVLGFQVYRQQATISGQRDQLLSLKKQIEANSVPKTAPLEYQEKCAEQAGKAFREMGYTPKDMAGYENHYNAKLNKCFLLAEDTNTKYSPTSWTFKSLTDAYEGKSYGEYSWHTVKDKKYWEVPPFSCKVVLPSDEEHICKSGEEFAELIRVFMQDR